MENPIVQTDEDPVEKQSPVSSVESAKKITKVGKPGAAATLKVSVAHSSSIKKKTDPKSGSARSSNLTKPTVSASLKTTNSVPVTRRKSTGGLPEKSPASTTKQTITADSAVGKKTNTVLSEPVRRSLPEIRRSSLPSVVTKPTSTRASVSQTRKSVPISPVGQSLSKSTGSDAKTETLKKASTKPALSVASSSRRVSSMSLDSSGSNVSRKTISKVSSPSVRSPSVSSGLRNGSLSSSLDRSSNLSGQRRAGTPQSKDSRFIVLPQVEIKAGDDVRLDLRGHRVRSLIASGLNLQPNLEFVYLRDNMLSTLEGIEILTRVKVLDLSFNDFKGPGFEPLENCKALQVFLQQLYLAGNQITSLGSLPELPNLEVSLENSFQLCDKFLSVAQNKLKSIAMASQPRLQVLAASKNKISTLKGFPHLPLLEVLCLGSSTYQSLFGVCLMWQACLVSFLHAVGA
ncbi:hypothetical protein CUMW_009130 [Citrus unshiu]|nr:hypothetical protein CUMW_009130 [Citrus unshiu]